MPDLRKTLRSFRFAISGMVSLFRYENNAKVHLLAAIGVIVAGFYVKLTIPEWCLVLIQIGLVWMAEAFNTSLEKLADKVSPEIHPAIKSVKDLAAGGVLIATLIAVIVGVLIFIPKLYLLWL